MIEPSGLHIGPDNKKFEWFLRSSYSGAEGWHFGAGNPEFWQHSDVLLKPNGILLDIGIGSGRSSMYFAHNGMKVLGVDNSESRVKDLEQMRDDIGDSLVLPIDVICTDALTEKFPEDSYDTVLLDYMLHNSSKAETLKLIAKAYRALKIGGHMWVRLLGKHDSHYDDALAHGEEHPEDVMDRDTIWQSCDCSGEYKPEPTVYLDPLDVNAQIFKLGGKVVHSQTIATDGRINIMYGEDWGTDMDDRAGGMITAIAQRTG